MEVIFLSIGKINTGWINSGITDYEKRICKYIKFHSKILPDISKGKNVAMKHIKEEEGKLFLNEISESDFIILLDERGHEYTSREFSSYLEKIMASGKKRIIFIIGGPFGFSEEIYKRKNAMLSLSKMTFTHEMAKLFASEQLYRALTILRGEPYHHD